VADIRKDDERAGAVIQRMRSMLKRREVELTWFDLNLLVAESISLVRSAGELRKVRVSFTSEQALPLVLGDRVQLQQVLLNLLLNAMDAVHDAAPERRQVSARVRLTEMHVEIAVADRGHGIPADKFSRVFEPFFTTKTNGLGLGLPISRSIVEAHGGRLRAENNVEGGAVFSFTVPVRADASDHSNR
jgi:two-component system sensor kinase FixL